MTRGNLIKKYKELLSLTQIFLFREYNPKQVKVTTPSTYAYFQAKMPFRTSLNQSKKNPPQPIYQEPKPISKQPPIASAPPPKPLPTPPAIPQTPKQPEAIIQLEPLNSPSHSINFHEFSQLFKNLFPDWQVIENIPRDEAAKKIKNGWAIQQEIPTIMILSFHENEKHLQFLKNVAQAITVRLAPARVFSCSQSDRDKLFERIFSASHLRLIIASDYGLYLQPELMRRYRTDSQHGKHFLDQIPLLLLSDLSLYLKEPQLKSLLWRAICNEFEASQPRQ